MCGVPDVLISRPSTNKEVEQPDCESDNSESEYEEEEDEQMITNTEVPEEDVEPKSPDNDTDNDEMDMAIRTIMELNNDSSSKTTFNIGSPISGPNGQSAPDTLSLLNDKVKNNLKKSCLQS